MSLSSVIGALRVNLSLDSAEFQKGVKDANNISYNFKKNLGSLVPSVAAVSGALVALGVHAVQSATELRNFSRVANASFEQFQGWAAGAKTVGVEADKLSDILKDVNDKVGDYLTTGGGGMADFFEKVAPKVGITADAFRDLSGPQALQLYVSSLDKAGLSQAEMTFHMEALASDATLLLPLLRNNGAEMNRLAGAAKDAGAILGDDTAASLTRTAAAINTMRTNFAGLTNVLVAEAAPAVERMANAVAAISSNEAVRGAVGALARNFDHIAALAGAATVVIGGRFLMSLIAVNGKVMSLARTMGYISTLRFGSLAALAGGPWIALAGAAALIGSELLLWKSGTDDASDALEAHARILDDVKTRYAGIKGEVKDWASIVEKTTKLQATESLNGLLSSRSETAASLTKDLTRGMSWAGADNYGDSFAKGFLDDLVAKFRDGGITVDEFKAKLQALTLTSNDAQKRVLAAAMDSLDGLRPVEEAITQARALVVLADDAADATAKAGAAAALGLGEAAKAADTATASTNNASTAAQKLIEAYDAAHTKTVKLTTDLAAAEAERVRASAAGKSEEVKQWERVIAEIRSQIYETRKLDGETNGFFSRLAERAKSAFGVIGGAANDAMSMSIGGGTLDEARRYVGLTARSNGEELQSLFAAGGKSVDPADVAWCAAFVNAVLGKMGVEGTGSLAARSFLNYGKSVDDPQPGDIVVFSRGNNDSQGHVGFYEGKNPDGTIRVLGGNQGGAVKSSNYSTDRLLGYRRAPLPTRAVDLAAQRDEDDIINAGIRKKRADEAAADAAREAQKTADEATREKEREADKVAREAEAKTKKQTDALADLRAEHEYLAATIGMTSQQQRIYQALQETGAAGDAARSAEVAKLIQETEALAARNELIRGIVGTLQEGFQDLFVGVLTGASKAKSAIANLASALARMAAQQAFSVLWNGTGNGFGGLGKAAGGILGTVFGGGAKVGANANGTPNWTGGLSWVGERGPELVNLSRGSSVISNRESRRMLEGGAGGTSRVVVELADGLVGNIVGQANDSAVRIVQSGLNSYDKKQSAQTFSRNRNDPRARG